MPAATVALVNKHPRAIRWMHWINFPVLTIMIWSGLLIYWGDSDPAVPAPAPGVPRRHRFVHALPAVSRLVLDHAERALPHHGRAWLALPGDVDFRHQRYRVCAVYLAVSAASGASCGRNFRHLRSFKDAIQVTLYDMHWPSARRKGLPEQGKYNGAQRIAYTAVTLMGAGSLITGLAIYKPTQAHWFTTLLGGYEMARWEHFWLTIGFCGFFVVHVIQVIAAGWNNFRSMVSGYEIQKRNATQQPIDAQSGEPTGGMHEDETHPQICHLRPERSQVERPADLPVPLPQHPKEPPS